MALASSVASAFAELASAAGLEDHPSTSTVDAVTPAARPPPLACLPSSNLLLPPDGTAVSVGKVSPIDISTPPLVPSPPTSSQNPNLIPHIPTASEHPIVPVSSPHPDRALPNDSIDNKTSADAATATPAPRLESDLSSVWTGVNFSGEQDGAPSNEDVSSFTESAEETQGRIKGFPNLAAIALSAIRNRNQKGRVHYYAQVDMRSVAYKRHKLSKKRYDFHLQLEGSDLIVTRRPRKKSTAEAIAAASSNLAEATEEPTMSIETNNRVVVNLRTQKVYVDHAKSEIVLHRKDRDRPLRLVLKTAELCQLWDTALSNAKECSIDSFYRLGDTVGRGAYGEVVEGFSVDKNEKRAVKIVKRGTSPKSIEHLKRELEVMRSVSHRGIVETHSIFAGKTIYIVMEYVPGGDLFDFVASHEVLTESQAAQAITSILGAVAYLHSNDVVHRDLKPENILCLNKSWPLETKITDFGFSTVLDPMEDSVMRTPVGTAYFMAPEIITTKGHGPPVDIWACGVILYTILTGRLPFPGRNRDEYFRNVAAGNILFPPTLWKGISEDALNLVKGMLNMDPKKRLNALGALQHKWITNPTEGEEDRGIKRNRNNLHSKRRRLFKARSAIIAVAMAQKFKASAIVDLFEKMPVGMEKIKEDTTRIAHKTADHVMNGGEKVGNGTRKVAEHVGEGVKKTGEGIKKGTQKAGDGLKKAGQEMEEKAKKVGEGVKKTGEGIKKGTQKAGDGLKKTKEVAKKTGDGVKKTAKKAGEGIKKGAEKVKIDKIKLKNPLDRHSNNNGNSSSRGAHTESAASLGGSIRERVKRKARAAKARLGGDDDSSGIEPRSIPEYNSNDVEEKENKDEKMMEIEEEQEAGSTSRGIGTESTSRGIPTGIRTESVGLHGESMDDTKDEYDEYDESMYGIGGIRNNDNGQVGDGGAVVRETGEEETEPAERRRSEMVSHFSNVSDAAEQGNGRANSSSGNKGGALMGEGDIEKHCSQVSTASSTNGNTNTGGLLGLKRRPKLAPLLLGLDTAMEGVDGRTSAVTLGSSTDTINQKNNSNNTEGVRRIAQLLLASTTSASDQECMHQHSEEESSHV